MSWLTSVSSLTPHGFCLSWNPGLLWLHSGTDALIALSYGLISISLFRLVRGRPDPRHRVVSLLFAAFILACGGTHAMGVLTLWQPFYAIEGLIKLMTALLSGVTAIVLWQTVPMLLKLPSRLEMEQLNTELRRQIDAGAVLTGRVEEGAYALQVATEEQRALFENSPDALFILRVGLGDEAADFRFKAANPAMERLVGLKCADLLERRPEDCWPPEHWTQLSAAYHRCIAEQRAVTFDSHHILHGRTIDLETSLAPARDPRTGVVTRIIGVKRDVTERKALQRQVIQMQQTEVTARLTTGFAHDFNNLLQALMGGLDMLVREVDGPAKQYAEMALQSARRGADLTHSLMAFSRLQTLEPAPVDLGIMAEAAADLVLASLGPDVRLTIDPPLFSVVAYVDAAQLQSALVNLLVNAGDALPEGGDINLCADRARPPPSLGLAAGDWARITVTDNGVGMPDAVLRQACEPFFTTKGAAGSGLGLSMVQGFVRQSGGDVVIQSAEGVGTRIELWLPLAEQPVAAVAPRVSPSLLPDPTTVHILAVDDAPEVLMAVSAFLRSNGWQVTGVTSGDQALDRLADGSPFDAVVTDYTMPKLNGLDLVRRARQLRPNLPAMIITGREAPLPPDDLDVAILRKPFSRETLVHEVSDLLSRHLASADAP